MKQQLDLYKKIVKNKYKIYNSLFMNLPYERMENLGMLLPFLYKESKEGFNQGKTSQQIIDGFFKKHTNITDESEKTQLLFHFVQYLERQVVLFDSIEEAAFPKLHSTSDKGTLENLYQISKGQKKIHQIKEKLKDFSVRVVFTAHPTQFYPNAVLRIIHELREAVSVDSISKIDTLLQQLGKTPFIKEQKPTPYDEALSIIHYLRYSYYDAVGELYDKVQEVFFDDDQADSNPNPQLIQLGFWPGGDRDGNPYVTADITKKVASQLRISLFKSYYNHVKFLRSRLTFKKVDDMLTELSNRLYENMFREESDLLLPELQQRVQQIKECIIKEHDGLFLKSITIFQNRLQLFGTHFATLDIRQDSRVHQSIINQIIKFAEGVDFETLSESEKIEILTTKSHQLNPNDFDDQIVKDTIQNVIQLRHIQQQNGQLGCHRYIISNSETIFDVLNVYALFKYCGYQDQEINFDIVPLFETMQGMQNSQQVMQRLYQLPTYSAHLKRRNQKQTIMLGFSDGTKDGGYLKANWEIYGTKEKLTQVSNNNHIKVIFFDGRGGPPARGGGKTHRFYAAQGNTIANNAIELTIQGQTITSIYGNKTQAKFNYEQLLTAGLFSSVINFNNNQFSDSDKATFNQLAELSYDKYKALKAHPKFVPYLEKMSTLKYYGKTNIGSRPSKRGASDELKFEDLRAIPFVGSWSLLKQNVPGYFGVGTAIHHYKNQNKLQEVKQLYQNSKFFKALILNCMMSLQKTYFPLTSYMKQNPEFSEFWQILNNEYELSKQMCLEVTGFSNLMQNEGLDKESIVMRDEIVLPLLSIQQYALENLQGQTQYAEVYEKLVTRCLFGNINASRNSA